MFLFYRVIIYFFLNNPKKEKPLFDSSCTSSFGISCISTSSPRRISLSETTFRLFLRFSTQMLLKLRCYFYNPISEFIYISG